METDRSQTPLAEPKRCPKCGETHQVNHSDCSVVFECGFGFMGVRNHLDVVVEWIPSHLWKCGSVA